MSSGARAAVGEIVRLQNDFDREAVSLSYIGMHRLDANHISELYLD